jgi:hypothetical protein
MDLPEAVPAEEASRPPSRWTAPALQAPAFLVTMGPVLAFASGAAEEQTTAVRVWRLKMPRPPLVVAVAQMTAWERLAESS